MEATIGDQICIRGNIVGHADRTGEIIEVHGMRGEPPYLVRFADGQTRLLFPGPDAVIVPQQRRASDALPVPRRGHGCRDRLVFPGLGVGPPPLGPP
jgi:hypothetical protein